MRNGGVEEVKRLYVEVDSKRVSAMPISQNPLKDAGLRSGGGGSTYRRWEKTSSA